MLGGPRQQAKKGNNMARKFVTTETNDGPKGDFVQPVLNSGLLVAATPKTTAGATEFRFIPELLDGDLAPMVVGGTPKRPLVSNLIDYHVVSYWGVDQKFTGIAEASDDDQHLLGVAEDKRRYSYIMPAIFWALKNKLDNKELAAEHIQAVYSAVTAPPKRSAPMSGGNRFTFAQGIMLELNGKAYAAPQTNVALALKGNAATAVKKFIEGLYDDVRQAWNDIYAPDTGHTIVLTPLPADPSVGRMFGDFEVSLGRPFPIDPDELRALWVDWDTAFVRHTRRELLEIAINCVGEDLVRMALPREVATLLAPAKPVARPAAPAAPAKLAAPTAPAAPAAPAASAKAAAPAAKASSVPLSLKGSVKAKPTEEDAEAATPAAAPAAATSDDAVVAEYESLLTQVEE